MKKLLAIWIFLTASVLGAANLNLSNIPVSGSEPALTDRVLGDINQTTTKLFTLQQIATTAASANSLTISNTILVTQGGNDATGARGNWSKPFRNIDAAASNSLAGMTIVVMAGTYTNLNPLYLSSNVNYSFIGKSTVIYTNTTALFTDRGTVASTGVYDVRVDAPDTTFYSTNDYFLETDQASTALRRTFQISYDTVWSGQDLIAMYGDGVTNIFKGRRAVSQNGGNGTIIFGGSGASHFEGHGSTFEAHTTSNGDVVLMFAGNYAKFVDCSLISTGTDTVNNDGGRVDFINTDVSCTASAASALLMSSSSGVMNLYGGNVSSASGSSEMVYIFGGSRLFAYGTQFTNAAAGGTALRTSTSGSSVMRIYGGSVRTGASGTDFRTGTSSSIEVSGVGYDPAKINYNGGTFTRLDNHFPDVAYAGQTYTSNGWIQVVGTRSLTADNQVVGATTNSFISLSSDAAVATDRTFVLTTGVPGKLITLTWTGTNAAELADDAANSGSGNVRLSAAWLPTQYDVLTLIGIGNDWHEVSRSLN